VNNEENIFSLFNMQDNTPNDGGDDGMPQFELRKLITEFAYNEARFTGAYSDFNLLDFWNQRKYGKKYRVLFKLSRVLLSMPISQSCVERTFSKVVLAFTPRRCRMSCSLLNNTLLLKDNLDIINNVKLI
jgi:hypothetical protein